MPLPLAAILAAVGAAIPAARAAAPASRPRKQVDAIRQVLAFALRERGETVADDEDPVDLALRCAVLLHEPTAGRP